MATKPNQGKIWSGSISLIVTNSLVNVYSKFCAFMKIWTIYLLYCRTK